jgi:hypothetical protein
MIWSFLRRTIGRQLQGADFGAAYTRNGSAPPGRRAWDLSSRTGSPPIYQAPGLRGTAVIRTLPIEWPVTVTAAAGAVGLE